MDADIELPVAVVVTPGNMHDGRAFEELLNRAKKNMGKGFKIVVADKGYDSGYNNEIVVKKHGGVPIIAIRGNSKIARRLKAAYHKNQTVLTKFDFKLPLRKDFTLNSAV